MQLDVWIGDLGYFAYYDPALNLLKGFRPVEESEIGMYQVFVTCYLIPVSGGSVIK